MQSVIYEADLLTRWEWQKWTSANRPCK